MIEIRQKYKGIIFIIFSSFSFGLMNVFIRLAGDLPSVQKSVFRNLVAFVFALIIMKRKKIKFSCQKKNRLTLFLRSAFGTLGILANYYAVDHLLLADSSMLRKMSAFFTVIFSYFVLKEKVSIPQAGFVAGAFAGSLLVIKPTFTNMNLVPALIGLAGAMFAGIAYTYVRKMTTSGEKGPMIVCFFSGFSCLVLLPFMIFDYHPMTEYQLAMLLLAGLAAAGGQFGITTAYTYAPSREISVYDYTQIIFSALLGFILFGQTPDFLSWMGYIIITLMGIGMFLYNKKKD